MSTLQHYMDNALQALDRLGLAKVEGAESQLAGLLEEVVKVDEPKVVAIARTVAYMGTFNEMVRDNIEACKVDDRYNDITQRFDSIRDDLAALVKQMEDGKIDFREKVSNAWMKLARGTPHKRFREINEIYGAVGKDTKKALEREDQILEGYVNFRLAVKKAEGLAFEVLQQQEKDLQAAREGHREAAKVVEEHKGEDQAQKSALELSRDEAYLKLKQEDKAYQLIKDVAESLRQGYQIGETLMAKLGQVHDLKEAVYRRSVTFFTTNEHVFTALDAVYTATHGLHEATQTVDAMRAGAEKGLEQLAELTGTFEKAAVRAAYGQTIDAKSVQKLVDAVVSYQENAVREIAEQRKLATENVAEVTRIVEDGKQRVSKAMHSYQAQE